jgi:hypothetical protein
MFWQSRSLLIRSSEVVTFNPSQALTSAWLRQAQPERNSGVRRAGAIRFWLATLAMVVAAPTALAESGFAAVGGKASAALDFRIIIPPVMQVLENSHPDQLQVDASGALSARQQLVVVSNMRHGFCVSLRMAEPQRADWHLKHNSSEPGVRLEPTTDGWRLCTSRPGHYTLQLQHQFGSTDLQTAQRWPVQTDLITP